MASYPILNQKSSKTDHIPMIKQEHIDILML